MVSHDDDVDAAMQVHLLQTVHQLTDDVIDLPQRVIQLKTGKKKKKQDKKVNAARLTLRTVRHPQTSQTHLTAERSQPMSEGVGLL